MAIYKAISMAEKQCRQVPFSLVRMEKQNFQTDHPLCFLTQQYVNEVWT